MSFGGEGFQGGAGSPLEGEGLQRKPAGHGDLEQEGGEGRHRRRVGGDHRAAGDRERQSAERREREPGGQAGASRRTAPFARPPDEARGDTADDGRDEGVAIEEGGERRGVEGRIIEQHAPQPHGEQGAGRRGGEAEPGAPRRSGEEVVGEAGRDVAGRAEAFDRASLGVFSRSRGV